MKVFNVRQGYQAMSASGEVWTTYLIIVLGIAGHWVWEVLVGGLPKGTFEFGSIGVVMARVVIALIAGIWSFTGIWQQLSGVDKKLRFFAAFTQGFAVEALTGPVVDIAVQQQ